MSSDGHGPTQNLPPGIEDQTDERIDWSRVTVIALGSLLLFAAGGVFSTWLLIDVAGEVGHNNQVRNMPELGAEQVGIVEQRMIENETRAQDSIKAQREVLAGYGWIDREKKLIHIPVDEAMKRVEAGQR